MNSGEPKSYLEGWEGLVNEALFKLTSEEGTWRSQQCKELKGAFQGWGAAKARKHLGAVKAVEAGKLAGAQWQGKHGLWWCNGARQRPDPTGFPWMTSVRSLHFAPSTVGSHSRSLNNGETLFMFLKHLSRCHMEKWIRKEIRMKEDNSWEAIAVGDMRAQFPWLHPLTGTRVVAM